jgi:hypothetical protein
MALNRRAPAQNGVVASSKIEQQCFTIEHVADSWFV